MIDKTIKIMEYISGGMAEGMTVEDIAKKHGVDVSVINKQIKMGIKIEHEHSPDDNVAAEISKDHLTETPFYYDYLEEMESEFKENYKEDLKRGGMEEEGEEEKGMKKASDGDVILFLKKSPNPSDDAVHAFAEKNKFEIHSLEAIFYKFATKYVKSLDKDAKDLSAADSNKSVALKRLFG